MGRTFTTGLGALALATGIMIAIPDAGLAQEHTVIRPTEFRPEIRIEVVGSTVRITHVENARQADSVFFQGEKDRYQRAATDPAARPYGLFLTYGMDGRAALIVLDMAWLREEDDLGFVDLMLFETGAGLSAVWRARTSQSSFRFSLRRTGHISLGSIRSCPRGAW